MKYWKHLIDVYESWDLDSLCDEAYDLSCAVRDDINRRFDVRDPLYATMMVGAYFVDADHFADGDEDALFRRMFEGQPLDLSAHRFLLEYRRNKYRVYAQPLPWDQDCGLRRLLRCARSLTARLPFGCRRQVQTNE